MVNFYFAGKISKNDWRDEITSYEVGETYYSSIQLRKDIDIGEGDKYVGPFFVACDHGCYHGANSHGAGAGLEGCGVIGGGLSRTMVHKMCLDGIRRCDVLYAWIDSKDCFGTISEIGYAAALGKKVWIAYEKDLLEGMIKSNLYVDFMVDPEKGVDVWLPDHCSPTHDMWFMSQFASIVHIGFDAVESFEQMRREMRKKHGAGI
ncbi:MAG: nucleoside 2-deoxyribosyltransferase [Methanolobus sp.]|nr:nucleoside 2-deoxyribosyltransferase [Methanolobus sp.]